MIVNGERRECDNPRLEFARALAKIPRLPCSVFRGEGCLIHPTAEIGAEGFGFERDEAGIPFRITHHGHVQLGSNVEVGPYTVICRGTVRDTVIFGSVKIDGQVWIAHNVTIGARTMIAAQTEVSGSVSIGEDCWIGAGCRIKENVTIGNGSTVGLGAVVVKDVMPGQVVKGNPAK